MTRPAGRLALATFLARRYLFSGRKRFAAFITWTSVIGLSLGVVVLTVVVSVMNGFDRELRGRLLGAVPHVFVRGESPNPASLVASLPAPARAEVLRADPLFQGQAMITHRGLVLPIGIQGVPDAVLRDPGHVPAATILVDDSTIRRPIVLGAPLAVHLGLTPGDALTLVLAEPTKTGIRPRLMQFQLIGTFELGAELDTSLALIPLRALDPEAQQALGTRGVRLMLHRPEQAPRIRADLLSADPSLSVVDWSASYGSFFRAVALEKSMMFVVLLLVVAVASFNIVAGQLMLVSDKRAEIAILRTFGATAATIRRTFVLQGVAIAALGIVVGLVLGVLAAHNISLLVDWLGQVTAYRLLEGTYFIELPSEVRGADLVTIAGLAVLLALFAALVPAARAARVSPIDGLKG
ncbi:MAG: FtsX-like permease family protein [Pseudomonadota bacterium]